MSQPLTLPPGEQFKLADLSSSFHDGLSKDEGLKQAGKHVEALGPLAEKLYAEKQRSVLLVLQGMDTSGKDGTIRHVLGGVNPQSCQVVPFKEPTPEELDHDFLWRVHRVAPARGNLVIFNRSHYEAVLVERVKKIVPKKVWEPRYGAINNFEDLLVEAGTTIVKVFLHISVDEQRDRLQDRLDNPHKRWKFRLGDLDDRAHWDAFQQAYEDALTHCNTKHAPWHVVPADHKWYRNLIISRLMHHTLEQLDPKYPESKEDLDGVKVK